MKIDDYIIKTSACSDKEIYDYIKLNPKVCLNYIKDDGSIDLGGVKNEMIRTRMNEVLEPYKSKIKKLNGADKRYYIKLKDSTKKDGRCTLKAPTEEELLKKIYKWLIENELKSKEYISPDEITFEQLHDEFLEYKIKTTWSESTVAKNESIWKNHFEGTEIVNVPIASIRLKQIQEWGYGIIESHNLTRKEFNNVSTWLKQMFEYCLMEEIIDKNPYQFFKITNPNKFRQIAEKPDENKVLTIDEEKRLYNKCFELFKNKHYHKNVLLPLAIIMLYQLGVRPSEVCTLKYDNISGNEITINSYYRDKSYVLNGVRTGTILEDKTKAGHGSRRIYLTKLAQEVIQMARQYQNNEGIKNPEYIFLMNREFKDGKVNLNRECKSLYDRIRKTFPKICESIGVPRNTPYSGRRTFISSLYDAKINLKTIQKYVGHNDSKTTLNNYVYDRTARVERAEMLENARLPFSFEELSVPTVPKTSA